MTESENYTSATLSKHLKPKPSSNQLISRQAHPQLYFETVNYITGQQGKIMWKILIKE